MDVGAGLVSHGGVQESTTMIRTTSLLLSVVIVASPASNPFATAAADDLAKAFASPPNESKPWCYWWWLNGYVSRDGIVRDLDEMRKQGISGALVFHAGKGETPKTIEFMSAEWRQFFRLAVEEAAKRGITIGLNLCGGWNAGGPWVTPDDAAKNLVYGLKRLKGPLVFDDVLHVAASTDKTYHDTAVLAWPIPDARGQHTPAKLTASSSYQDYSPEFATDGDPATRWISNGNRPGAGPRPDRPEYLQWTFDAEFAAAAIHIVPFPQCGPRDCEVQASADGKTFRTVARFEVEPEKPKTVSFDETTARWFRLVVTSSHPHRGQANWNVQIAEVSLLRKGEKAAGNHCRSKGILDLTARMNAAGRLKWDVPEGNWLVVRLKDIGDRAFCAGLNRNMLCFFVSQPEEQSWPGYEWPGVGMEFDRHVTWWPMSASWLTYLARCQHLLQAGRFVADVCYLQGEWVPSYVPARWAMDPPLPRGCDCDTINAETLLDRATVGEDGALRLRHGQSYRYLVLCQGGAWKKPRQEIFGKATGGATAKTCPDSGSGKPLALSPATLKKLVELVRAGATVIGPRPERAIGLSGYPHSDVEIKELADQLWGAAGERRVGKGRVISGRSLADVMRADNILPDLEIHEDPQTAALPRETFAGIPSPATFDWIHRTIGDAEVYFVANLRNAQATGEFCFRVPNGKPELWDPVTGEIRALAKFRHENGRTIAPMKFEPRQGFFVVFSSRLAPRDADTADFLSRSERTTLAGPWEVSFDPKWGGPERVTFEKLDDWSKRPEPGIRHYSGTAVYRTTFQSKAEPA